MAPAPTSWFAVFLAILIAAAPALAPKRFDFGTGEAGLYDPARAAAVVRPAPVVSARTSGEKVPLPSHLGSFAPPRSMQPAERPFFAGDPFGQPLPIIEAERAGKSHQRAPPDLA